jgi:L-ascorbate metabolism protein UlaG (beta-lactamase superfamily)
MEPEQAALAGELLGARTVIPMHYGGFALDPFYQPVDDPLPRFEAAASGRPYEVFRPEAGESLESPTQFTSTS